MSELTFAFLWCIAQVTLVSAAALVVAWIVTNRRPEFAAKTAGWAAVVVLVSTLLVPFQMPTWQLPSAAEARSVAADISPHERQPDVATDSQPEPVQTEGTIGFQFDPAFFVQKTSEFRESLPPTGMRIGRYIAIGFCLVAAGCVVKFVLGFVLLRRLRRRAEVIRDCQLDALANEIQTQLGGIRHVAFAESPEIGCGAVVGIIRPTVLFSCQWKSWTPGELRAVLAHEMAHISRRDSLWRFIATVCSAIHFYNPLFRWLVRRLVLAQELAADRLAIAVAGGPVSYLRSLSQLAIQQDRRPSVRPQPLSMPVFTGHLMRRIEMLQAMDCEQNRSPRSWLSFGVIALIVLFGIATTVMRGFAQTSDQNKSARTPVTSESAKNVIDEPVDLVWNSTLFQRKGSPTTHPSFSKQGALHINFSAQRQSESLALILESIVLGEMLPKVWAENFDLRLLESITSDVKPFFNGDKVGYGLGKRGIVLRTTRDVDWKAAIADRHPDHTKKTLHGLEYLQVTLPSMGPMSLRLRPVSQRELSVSLTGPPGGTDEWQIGYQKQAKPPWASEWNAVSGGVFSFVLAIPEQKTIPSFEDEIGAEQRRVIYQGINLISIGVDISQDARIVEGKIRLRCVDSANRDQVRTAVRELIALYKDDFDKRILSNAGNEMTDRMTSDALKRAKIRLAHGNPQVIECNLQFALPKKILRELAAERTKRKVAPSVKQTAEKPAASTIKR